MRTFNREPKEVLAEAKALAKALGLDWVVEHQKNNCWCFMLHRHDQTLHISLNNAPKRYVASINWPNYKSEWFAPAAENRIGCNFQRGPEALAAEIKRRLLPVLDAHWEESVAWVKKQQDTENKHNTVMNQLAELLETTWQEHYMNRVIAHHYGVYEVVVNGDTATMKTNSLPIAVVEKVIKLLKAEMPK